MSGTDGTRRSMILAETVNGLTPVLLAFSIFLTFRGHNAPGGGFAGGLVMAAAVILRYLASGPEAVRSLRIDPIVLIGAGLALAALVGTWPLLDGGEFLESSIWKFHPPLIGEMKLVSSSLFDIGVHVLVVGVVMAVLVAFVEADDEVARANAAREELRSNAGHDDASGDPGTTTSGGER
ncbi:MAG: MnhB domain-containing protein [Microthrixaceae bacterium]|nr:MnhB domain-containing protein [Microthrixaceae bacterium]